VHGAAIAVYDSVVRNHRDAALSCTPRRRYECVRIVCQINSYHVPTELHEQGPHKHADTMTSSCRERRKLSITNGDSPSLPAGQRHQLQSSRAEWHMR
jgi:hypothetical protein